MYTNDLKDGNCILCLKVLFMFNGKENKDCSNGYFEEIKIL